MKALIWAATAAAALSATSAGANVLFAFEETQQGVFGTLSGSLNIDNAVSASLDLRAAGIEGHMIPSDPELRLFPGGGSDLVPLDSYELLRPIVPFGTGGSTQATERSGSIFWIEGDPDDDDYEIRLARGYQSGTALSGTLEFAGATYESLGVTPGIYVFELAQLETLLPVPDLESVFAVEAEPSGTLITVSFRVADDPEVIPLPAGLPLLLAGLGGFALMRRTRG